MMANGRRILIVDDEEGFLSLIQEALTIRGFEVIVASNAVAAGMEIALKKPEAILMDIKMSGIDGLQACEAIKRNPITKDIPIMIVSALSGDSDIKKAYRAGVLDYFIKPINIEKVVAKLKDVLGIA
ncbi:MAG: response regulator [Candidatus Omnitrophica bacterium]|nr:response regulator [Candidatus Omnitrophota bacterium]